MATIYFINSNSVHIPLKSNSIHCVATSPPYFALRQYDGEQKAHWPEVRYAPMPGLPEIVIPPMEAELGLEPTVEAYVGHLVLIFREVKRVLHPTGTFWLNIGDSYSGSWGNSGHRPELDHTPAYQREKNSEWINRGGYREFRDVPPTANPQNGLKPKDMCGVPWRVAFALQADGWYLRSAPEWLKSSAMPESVQDRPSRATENVFLFAKEERYYYDRYAVLKPLASVQKDSKQTEEGELVVGRNRRTTDWWNESLDAVIQETAVWLNHARQVREEGGLLVDDVGTPLGFFVNPKGWSGAHFAVWPPHLVRPMLLASTSERGCCPQCLAPWERVVVKPDMKKRPTRSRQSKTMNTDAVHINNAWDGHPKSAGQSYQEWRNQNPDVTIDWRPTCICHFDGLESDDLEIIATPTGERAGDDPTLQTGRAGFNRLRGDNEGQRPITRYEQRQYAAQLKKSPHRKEMELLAGGSSTFAHYIRTDRSGARPLPADLLEEWIERGWLERVVVPSGEPAPPIPCRVLDPFAGTGTTGIVARELGRDALLIDISLPYLLKEAYVRTGEAALRRWKFGETAQPEFEEQDEDYSDLGLFALVTKHY